MMIDFFEFIKTKIKQIDSKNTSRRITSPYPLGAPEPKQPQFISSPLIHADASAMIKTVSKNAILKMEALKNRFENMDKATIISNAERK